MKKIIFICAAFIVMFSACKKEQVSLDEAEITLSGEKEVLTKLNLYNNEIDYDIMLPSDLDISEVELKITTEADPTGIVVVANLSKGSYKDGKKEVNYLRATGILQVGAFSDVDREMIKVKSTTDKVTVVVGDDIVSGSMDMDAKQVLSITNWPEITTDLVDATIFLYGYSFDGSENPKVIISSSHDSKKVEIMGDYNDPTQYNGMPAFNTYDFDISFQRNGNTSGQTIGVTDGCEIYIEYKNTIYVGIFNENTSLALLPLAK